MAVNKLTGIVSASVLLALALVAALPGASAHVCNGSAAMCGDCKDTLFNVIEWHYQGDILQPYCSGVGEDDGGAAPTTGGFNVFVWLRSLF